MARYHDFEDGDVVYFKPEYLRPDEDPKQAYVIVRSHPESMAIDVKPIGWECGPYVPVTAYPHRCFMRIGDELGLEAERTEARL